MATGQGTLARWGSTESIVLVRPCPKTASPTTFLHTVGSLNPGASKIQIQGPPTLQESRPTKPTLPVQPVSKSSLRGFYL